ncbi:MAG: hypothetical protein AAF212_02515 [Verrucomicrobiota bacterium]
MQNFFEFLPILLIILASIGPKILELFQRKNDQKDDRQAPPDSQEQRRVKEEIRRRIEAARQGRDLQDQPRQQRAPQPPVTSPRPQSTPQRRPSPPPLTPTAGPNDRQLSGPDLEPTARFDPNKTQRELQEAQERLEASNRRLAEAKQKAKERRRHPAQSARQSGPSVAAPELLALDAQSLRKTLRNKKEIRRAIVLSEVLGKPISQRNT